MKKKCINLNVVQFESEPLSEQHKKLIDIKNNIMKNYKDEWYINEQIWNIFLKIYIFKNTIKN